MTPTKGELRQAELLEVAERVLITTGNAQASMRAIAAEAKVRIGHLQHYYPTRSDLIQALLDRVLSRSLDRMREASGVDLVGEDSPVNAQQVDAVVAALLAQHEDPDTVRLYVEIWAMAASDDSVADAVRSFYDSYVALAERIVCRARPELSPARTRARAFAVVSLLEGAALMHARFVRGRPADTDAELRRAVQCVIFQPD